MAPLTSATVWSGAGTSGPQERPLSTQIVRSPAAWPPPMSLTGLSPHHPATVAQHAPTPRRGQSEVPDVRLTRASLLRDEDAVHAIRDPGGPQLRPLDVHRAVGRDPHPPADRAEFVQPMEDLSGTGHRGRDVRAVGPPQLLRRRVQPVADTDRVKNRRIRPLRHSPKHVRLLPFPQPVPEDELSSPTGEHPPPVHERVVEVKKNQRPPHTRTITNGPTALTSAVSAKSIEYRLTPGPGQ